LKIIVAGGAGFIGSNLSKYWYDNNAEVNIIDNLRSGHLENLTDMENIKFYEGSITDKNFIEPIFVNADYVFNFAAMVSVEESVNKPELCESINLGGLKNILEAASECRVKKVVHASSAAVYGEEPGLPKKENDTVAPISPYGQTKLDGEKICEDFTKQKGMKTVCLRYFNVYGMNQRINSAYAAVIPNFINQALNNEPLIINGDGEQTRDFVFVNDVVNANVLSAINENITGVYNISNESVISIKQLARKIIELTDSNSEIIFNDPRKGDIKHSYASTEKARSEFGYKPTYNLDTGLVETIEYFKRTKKD